MEGGEAAGVRPGGSFGLSAQQLGTSAELTVQHLFHLGSRFTVEWRKVSRAPREADTHPLPSDRMCFTAEAR